MAYLTVFTATYNRADLLKNVYKSLKKQTFKDFEWLIVDDGSTDGSDKVIEQLRQNADFQIRYYWKENGGNHTARNYSYPLIRTRYVVSMDSDDEFADNALQRIHDIWESIPRKDYERYWQISGRCKDSVTGEMLGPPYPPGINSLTGKQQIRARVRVPDEKCCCRKTEILIQYPFPEYRDVKFVSEDTVWNRIDQKYDTYCTNEIFRIYNNSSADSMGKGRIHSKSYRKTQWYHSVAIINELFDWIFFDKKVITAIFNISRLTWLSETKYSYMLKCLNSVFKRGIVMMVSPAAWIFMKLYDKKV